MDATLVDVLQGRLSIRSAMDSMYNNFNTIMAASGGRDLVRRQYRLLYDLPVQQTYSPPAQPAVAHNQGRSGGLWWWIVVLSTTWTPACIITQTSAVSVVV